MSLVKRTYVDQETVITAENLNAIQDAIIENEEAIEDQGEAIEGKYSKPAGGIPASDMASGVQTSLGKAESAYQKPSGGIPASDMASGVQTSLGKAESAYQKPSGGIPASDMASGVQTSLGKAESAYQKPSGGIPASDMASGVQTSLGKADSALQAVPNTYRTAAAQDLIDADKVDKADYNPESKTSAMTQPVGKDANGKLWTQPPAAAAQSDWSETDTTSPAFIKNKPTIPDISQLESDVQDLQGDLAALDAGDVAYDNSLTYAAGTVGQELSSQRNTLNLLEDDLGDLCVQSSVIVSNSFTNPISCAGLTANHVVCNWGLFSDAQCTTPISPNNPPADITIEEGTDQYNLTIQNSSGTFYLKPTFILPQN